MTAGRNAVEFEVFRSRDLTLRPTRPGPIDGDEGALLETGRRPAGKAGFVAAVLLCLLTAGRAAVAQERVTFDFDDPPETDHRITDSLSYGLEAELEGIYMDEQDRDGDNEQFILEPKLAAALTYQPNELLRLYLDLELARRIVTGSADTGESDKTSLGFKEAYVTLREVPSGMTLQVGRQLFQDPLEWFYDQEIDAVRGYYRFANLALEGSVSEQGFVDEDFLNNDDIDKVRNAFLVGHAALGEETDGSAYLLFRDGRDRNSEDLAFFGIQAAGEAAEDLSYWLNAAYVIGDLDDDDGSRDIRGYGLDLFGTYAPDLAWGPSLTLGFAFGSGDGDPDDGVDRNFRQTGLQSNNASFNGVTRFNYYGEAFGPELSNLAVFTLGAGLRPDEESSIDLVYHYYRQDEESDELRDSNLTAEPNGRSRDLGHEVDLVIGYLGLEDINAELIAGAFFPGQAFGNDADNAYFVSFEIQYEF